MMTPAERNHKELLLQLYETNYRQCVNLILTGKYIERRVINDFIFYFTSIQTLVKELDHDTQEPIS